MADLEDEAIRIQRTVGDMGTAVWSLCVTGLCVFHFLTCQMGTVTVIVIVEDSISNDVSRA